MPLPTDTTREPVERLITELCPVALDAGMTVWEFGDLCETLLVRAALIRTQGNSRATARMLGAHRNSIPRLVRKYRLMRRAA
jgi:DNA-binding NtrC family response regulator